MKGMIVVRVDRCLGCNSCQVACAVEHSASKNLLGAIGESPAPRARVRVEPGPGFAVPLQCRHCEDAPCVLVCPTEAIYRPDESSPVLIDADRCIGCRFCIVACPFGVIEPSRDGKAMVKCDLCVQRAAEGLQPACVAGCPVRAIKLEDVVDFLRDRRRQAGEQLAASRRQRSASESSDEPGKG